MNYIKIILAVVGLIILAMIALSVFSIVYTALWYLFFIGVLVLGGAVGYKVFTRKKESPQLKENTPTAIAEMDRADRVLEEYRRKYLSE